MRRLILAVIALLLIAAPAMGDGGRHDKEDTTTTTEATTTTTTKIRYVEVCVDEAIILVPWEPDIEDKYDVVKTDQDRKHCLPKPPTPTVTTLPGGIHVTFPPTTAVGTDPLPQPEIPDIPRDWVSTTMPLEYVPLPNVVRPDTLPFTGIPVWAWVLASIIMLGGGISLVRSIEDGDDEPYS